MKNHLLLFSLLFLLLGLTLTACCPDTLNLPPPASVEIAIYNSTGTDNLFDADGPYSMDSLFIFEADGITPVDYLDEPELGAIYLNRYSKVEGAEVVRNTYVLHIPNGEIDTLIGEFNRIEGDRCSSSYWTFNDLFYNGVNYTETDDNGFVKVLR